MIRVVAESPSIVLRSTHVLVVRIEASAAESWSTVPDGWRRRGVDLSLRLEERLKGQTREEPGAVVDLRVIQYASTSPWGTPLPGVWSERAIAPGDVLVAFSRSTSDGMAELLIDPVCEVLEPEEVALPDARLALQAEREDLDLARLLAAAGDAAGSLGYVFIDYLWEVHGGASLADPEGCELLMGFLERRDLALTARAALLSHAVNGALADPAQEACRGRLILAMFRLLDVDAAAPLRENLAGTYLPSVLGLSGGEEALVECDEVFAGLPEERAGAAARVREQAPEQTDLLGWLGGSPPLDQ